MHPRWIAVFGGMIATACGEAPGQITLAIQTDMAVPKDIDTVAVQVLNRGVPKFDNVFEELGTPSAPFALPATLTLLGSEEPGDPIEIRLVGRHGGKSGTARVLREAVTTVPTDRVARLELPLQYLCDGFVKEVDGVVTSSCPDGQTCIGGNCEEEFIASDTLPDDSGGGGDASVCLDVASCFADAVAAPVSETNCTIAEEDAVNVALWTEGDGVCGALGCYVVLDAGSVTGWQSLGDGRIQLPLAVCSQLESGAVVGVVTAPTSTTCPLKLAHVPACTGADASYAGPRVLAGGQDHPLALALASDRAYWASSGLESGIGTIKSVSLLGGKPLLETESPLPPRELIVSSDGVVRWTVADADGNGGIYELTPGGSAKLLVGDLVRPQGLAVKDGAVFWTEFAPDGHVRGRLISGGAVGDYGSGFYPHRLLVDVSSLFWTNEGTFGQSDGSIVRKNLTLGGVPEAVATDQATPRDLALELDELGVARAVYWTSFADDGSIMRATLGGDGEDPVIEQLATGLPKPDGIALFDEHVYWTHRDAGTVVRLANDAAPGTEPELLASGQGAASRIRVEAGVAVWIDEGSTAAADGRVMILPTP